MRADLKIFTLRMIGYMNHGLNCSNWNQEIRSLVTINEEQTKVNWTAFRQATKPFRSPLQEILGY